MAEKTPSFVSSHNAGHSDTILAKMLDLQQNRRMTDFTIKVHDKTISCHRTLLSAACPYFEALFSSDWKEAQQGEVTMDTLNYVVLNSVIQHLYGKNVTIGLEDIEEALDICEMLQIPDLKDQLTKFLLDNVSADTCIRIWKVSEKYIITKLGEKARNIMCLELEKVACSSDFKHLTLAELIDYIRDEDMQTNRRDGILYACIEWLKYDPASRRDNMFELMTHVQLDQCTLSAIEMVGTKHHDLVDEPKVMEMMFDAVLQKIDDGLNSGQLVVLGGMVGYGSHEINRNCWLIDFDKNQWDQFAEFPSGSQANQSPVVCLPDGFVVMCGGQDFRENIKYQVQNMSWVDLPPTPIGLQDTRAVHCSGAVYLLGGKTKHAVDVVCHLDLATNKWHQDAPMLEESYWVVATATGKDTYAIATRSRKLQHHRVGASMWQFKCSLPSDTPNTVGTSLVASKDHLYLVGGYDKAGARYSLTKDTWEIIKPPALKHHFGTAVMTRNVIYLVGDVLGETRVEEYDTEENEWSVSNFKLPKCLSFCCAAFVTFR